MCSRDCFEGGGCVQGNVTLINHTEGCSSFVVRSQTCKISGHALFSRVDIAITSAHHCRVSIRLAVVGIVVEYRKDTQHQKISLFPSLLDTHTGDLRIASHRSARPLRHIAV